MLFFVALCGAADGACQGSLFGEAACIDPRYVQALVAGTAVSGVAASLLRILTKAAVPSTALGLRISADIYFVCTAATLVSCLYVYMRVLPSTEEYIEGKGRALEPSIILQSRQDSTDEATELVQDQIRDNDLPSNNWNTIQQHKSTYIQVAHTIQTPLVALVIIYVVTLSIFPGVLAEDLQSDKFGSWFPVLLIATFNCADCLGKWLPALPTLELASIKAIAACSAGRVFFIPLFYIAANSGASVGFIGILTVLLGVSNGFLTSAAFLAAPKLVAPVDADLCGNIMVLALVVGLCIGAACGFLWLL